MGTVDQNMVAYCRDCKFYKHSWIDAGVNQCRHPNNTKYNFGGVTLQQTSEKPKCCPK